MTLWQAAAACMLIAATVAALRDTGTRMAPYALAVGGSAVALFALSRIGGALSSFAALVENSPLSAHASVLLRGVGIAYVTKLGGDTCRDLGAETVANRLEFCGRAEVILLALPYVTQLISWATGLVEANV